MLKRHFVVVLFGSLLAAAIVASAHAGWTPAAMNKQVDQTNFLVNNNCSATLIDHEHGYLLTANHCIQAQFDIVTREKVDESGHVTEEKVRVAKPGTVSQLFFADADMVQKNSYTFNIKANDEDLDLALIQVKAKLQNNADAPIACNEPVRGEVAYAVGNTLGVLYASISRGNVASVNRNYRMIGVDDKGDNGLIQSTTPIGGGNSGGALYNDKGEIIGVVVRGYQAVAPIALSVPLSDVKKFLTQQDLNVLWEKRCK